MNQRVAATLAVLLVASIVTSQERKVSGILDTPAIYADGSALYVNPQEPTSRDRVTLKLRTRKANVSECAVRYGDTRLAMLPLVEEGEFEYWFAELPPQSKTLGYYFEVRQGTKVIFYSRRGIEQKPPSNSYQFKIIPDFKVPDWMKGAVLYQIYIDRFYNGDPKNDVLTNEYLYDNWPSVRVEDWYQLPDAGRTYASGSNRTREFFGGDIQGVIDKLDYLADLGIDGIYFNPLFVSPSNHKYDAQDYEYIDPHVGTIVVDGGELIRPQDDPNFAKPGADAASTVNAGASKYILRTTSKENLEASNQLMRELVAKAHEKGIRIILDGVFNHSGSFNKWLDREHLYPESEGPGAYESADSPFVNYFNFSDPNGWPNNESYEGWWGYRTLPKLIFEKSDTLLETILGIGAKWVSPASGVDGWRLDVAADLGMSPGFNHYFWKLFRERVKASNPEAIILAEVYGDSSAWLGGDEWDSVMNYDAFFEPIGWYFTGLEKHSYNKRLDLMNDSAYLEKELREKMAKLPYNSLEVAMNQLDNHDHSRFLSRTSGYIDATKASGDYSNQVKATEGINKGILKEATMLQMALPGAPTLYYGDEAGLAGLTDPDSRRTYPWGREDQELLSFFKEIISIHKRYSALKTGSYAALSFNTRGMFAIGRWDKANRVVVAINNNAAEDSIVIPLRNMGFKDGESVKAIFYADKESHGPRSEAYVVERGRIEVRVPAYGGLVLASESGSSEPAPIVAARPSIVSAYPSGKVGSDATIAIRFSEGMNQGDITHAFSISPKVEGRFSWNGEYCYFVPSSPLPRGAYTVKVSESVSSRAGGFGMAKGFEWSFTVE